LQYPGTGLRVETINVAQLGRKTRTSLGSGLPRNILADRERTRTRNQTREPR
jgi:hypothetical protein